MYEAENLQFKLLALTIQLIIALTLILNYLISD